jgi:hypothetical protein
MRQANRGIALRATRVASPKSAVQVAGFAFVARNMITNVDTALLIEQVNQRVARTRLH